MSLYELIFESDEHIRKLERRAASGDPEAGEHFERARTRAGAGMAHHIDNYVKAWREFQDHPATWATHKTAKSRALIQKLRDARDEVHRQAVITGKGAGHFLTRDHADQLGKDGVQGRSNHIRHIARLHGGRAWQGDQDYGVSRFRSEDDARAAHAAVNHHYHDSKAFVARDIYDNSDDKKLLYWRRRRPQQEQRRVSLYDLVFESDERLRRLEREFHSQPGDLGARAAYLGALRRTGDHDRADRHELADHLDRLHSTFDALTKHREDGRVSLDRMDARTEFEDALHASHMATQRLPRRPDDPLNQNFRYSAVRLTKALDSKRHPRGHFVKLLMRAHDFDSDQDENERHDKDESGHRSVHYTNNKHDAASIRINARNLDASLRHHGIGRAEHNRTPTSGGERHEVSVHH